MRLITAQDGTSVKIFSSAKELTIERYTELQKQLVMQAYTGSDTQSIASSIEKLSALIADDKKDEATIQCDNLKKALNAAMFSTSYYTTAFAVLVAEIGKETYSDMTNEGLQTVVDRLKEIGVTYGQIESSVEEVKKK